MIKNTLRNQDPPLLKLFQAVIICDYLQLYNDQRVIEVFVSLCLFEIYQKFVILLKNSND